NRPGFVEGRPISGASADVVRFDLSANTSSTAGAIRTVNGVRVLTLGLNAPRSSNIAAALNAVRPLRPNPLLTQVELLESTGNSFYHGGIFSLRYSTQRLHLRAVYTISKFIDEGTTNTASPQNLRDRRAERALSLQDQRHRIVVSGVVAVPLLRVDFAPVVSVGSSRPFNIGAGFDRNLNDISNDRPNFLAELGRPVWRRPGKGSARRKGVPGGRADRVRRKPASELWSRTRHKEYRRACFETLFNRRAAKDQAVGGGFQRVQRDGIQFRLGVYRPG